MARIRSIKPEFWTDGDVVMMSPHARLMFIGMWNFTLCDRGHVADDAIKLKLQILPMDNINPVEIIEEIVASGRVDRIHTPDGRTFLHVRRFNDHQKVDPRWNSRCPACTQLNTSNLTETHASFDEAQRDSPKLSLGKDRKGKESNTSSTAKPPMEFDSFWQSYPRKVGKQAAMKAYAKALKSTTHEQIMSGLEELRTQVAGKDPQYIPHPTTWLNQGRWEDEAPSRVTNIRDFRNPANW